MSSFLANSSVQKVATGMMQVVEVLEHYTKAEKHAILAAVFNCMYRNKLSKGRTVNDVMETVDRMRTDCKRKKIPEFGGAERFITKEL